MDSKQFDAVARALSSRRTVLAILLGGAAAHFAGGDPDVALAHNPANACRKLADPVKRRRCLRRAQAHKRRCHSQTPLATCAGRCGSLPAPCGKVVTCPCPAGKLCLSNNSCSRFCSVPGVPGDCPAGCSCGGRTTEDPTGTFHCYPNGLSCLEVSQGCASTAQCPSGHFCAPNACPGPSGTFENRCIPVCQL